MKRILVIMLALAMALGLMAGCGNTPSGNSAATPTPAAVTESPIPSTEPTVDPNAKVDFTDSAGRIVELPAKIDKVAIASPLAQIALFALAPEKLVGIASEWDTTAEQFLDTQYYQLPVLGQLYGGKGEMNLETLLNSGAEVVIDVGEPKDTIVEDLDALSEQTGIPFVHITMTTATVGDAYRKLGALLNMPAEAETLAAYCEGVYSRTLEISNAVEKANVLYCLGDSGLNVIANGSYHSEVIDLLTNNLAVVDQPSSKGTGNEVDMEQMLLWNPDIIIFAPDSVYATVGADATWQKLKAIKDGNYYEAPFGPYNWLGFPPSVQRYLGMMWMAKLLYPDAAAYDLYAEVQEYFELFYHATITQEQYDGLVANSIGVQQAKPAA